MSVKCNDSVPQQSSSKKKTEAELRTLLTNCAGILNTEGVSEMITKHLRTNGDIDDLFKRIYGLICSSKELDETVNPTKIPWLPTDTGLLRNLVYLSGSSPWSFHLTYSDAECCKRSFSPDTLLKVIGSPSPLSFVACLYGNKLVRAFVISVPEERNELVELLDIDSHESFSVSTSELHYMPEELADIPALAIHCCIFEDDDPIALTWSDDLEPIFVDLLKQSSLSIKVSSHDASMPPKFFVQLLVSQGEEPLDVSTFLKDFLQDSTSLSGLCKDDGNDFELPLPKVFLTRSPIALPASWLPKVVVDKCDYCSGNAPETEITNENDWLNSPGEWDYDHPLTFPINCLTIGDRRCIRITKVLSGSKFYMVFEDREESNDFYALLKRLNCSQTIRSRCTKHALDFRVGSLVAYRNDKGSYSRGIVTKLFPHGVALFDPDLGWDTTAILSELRALSPVDRNVRFMAISAELHNMDVAIGLENEAKSLLQYVAKFNLNVVIKKVDTLSNTVGVHLYFGMKTDVNDELLKTRMYSYK